MIHAGETNSIKIWVNPQPPKGRPDNPIDLSTAVGAFLKIRPSGGATIFINVTPIFDSQDPMKHYCLLHYDELVFPLPGSVTVQLTVTFANSNSIESDEEIWTIGESL